MNPSHPPGLKLGALVGAMLTPPLLALFYLGDQLAGLPFVPFDLFDWLARILPGEVIRRAIRAMVDVIRGLNLDETSSAAKSIEQMMGLLLFLGIGIAASAVLYRVNTLAGAQHAVPLRNRYLNGFILSAVLGFAAVAISLDVNVTSTVSPPLGALWTLALFALWGAALSWVYSDLAAIGLEARHVRQGQRPPATTSLTDPAPPPVSVEDTARSIIQMDRRTFLIRIGGATATLTILGAGVGVLFGNNSVSVVRLDSDGLLDEAQSLPPGLPNANAALRPAPGTRLEYTPLADHYRIDINLRPPNVDAAGYALRVKGLGDERAVSLSDIREKYEPVHHYITLSCISNPVGGDLIGTTKWTGVPFKTLLDDWGVRRTTRYMKITSADGFDEYVELQLARTDERVMLVYAWDDKPLTNDHGFPLRIYIPDRYGMKQPKWITEIEFTNEPGEGYWVRRGWSESAVVNPTAVIDTIATTHAYEQGGMTYIPMGGIAYAGAKGISRVEVQVDDGDWAEARLRDPISELTWVIWRYDWAFSEGRHQFKVRCYDGRGGLQPTDTRDTFPSGATGVHTWNKTIQLGR